MTRHTLLLWAEDSERELRAEVAQSFPKVNPSAHPSVLDLDLPIVPGRRLPYLAFARQLLPNARPVRSESIRAWAGELFQSVAGVLAEDKPWALHLEPRYGALSTHRIGARAWHSVRMRNPEGAAGKDKPPPDSKPAQPRVLSEAGRHRCHLIREALLELLQKKRRYLLRQLRGEPARFTPDDSLVQLLLTAPETGFISVALAPLPFEQRHLLSAFPNGQVPVAGDKTAPSRAFAKLVEAEARLGQAIRAGETCVDLGAAPGSWTYVAANRGARVTAVDRSPLREDLARHPQVQFQKGDAFRFEPPHPVDWLLCDLIAAPERTADLLLQWLRHGWCRHFIVTLKLKDDPGAEVLARLKRDLPRRTGELFLTRLCANKKEVCAFGSRAAQAAAAKMV